jgi:hypothetical protein
LLRRAGTLIATRTHLQCSKPPKTTSDLEQDCRPGKTAQGLDAIAARHGGASNEARVMAVLAEVKRVNAARPGDRQRDAV